MCRQTVYGLPVLCTERWSVGSDNGTQNGSSVCVRTTTTAGSPSTLQSNSRSGHRGLRWTRLDRGARQHPWLDRCDLDSRFPSFTTTLPHDEIHGGRSIAA